MSPAKKQPPATRQRKTSVPKDPDAPVSQEEMRKQKAKAKRKQKAKAKAPPKKAAPKKAAPKKKAQSRGKTPIPEELDDQEKDLLDENGEGFLDVSDPKLDILDSAMGSLESGDGLSKEMKVALARLTAGSDQRGMAQEIVLRSIDQDRLNLHARVTWACERFLYEAMLKGKMKIPEVLQLMASSKEESERIRKRRERDLLGDGDLVNLLEQVNDVIDSANKQQSDRFKGVTPQGLEIVRKLQHGARKLKEIDNERKGIGKRKRKS